MKFRLLAQVQILTMDTPHCSAVAGSETAANKKKEF